MADLAEINTALVGFINDSLEIAAIDGVSVGSEWPGDDALKDAAGAPVIAVIHKTSNYRRMGMDYESAETDKDLGTSSELSDTFMGPTLAVTLSVALAEDATAVVPGDTISFIIQNADVDDAATYVAIEGDGINEVAAGLAVSIHTQFPLLTAVATGPDIVITNGDTVGYQVATHTGNGSTVSLVTAWATRSMQINIWSGNLDTKFQLRLLIEELLLALNGTDGFALESTEWVAFKLTGAKPDDAETDKDVFCDMFLFMIEHACEIDVAKYPVVATPGTTGLI